MKTPTSAPARTQSDQFPPEVTQLLGTARRVIDQHLNADGQCTECASVWPCRRARLAETALAVL